MESRLIHRIIEEIARGRRWTFEEAVHKTATSDPSPYIYGSICVVRVQTNGERIEDILREARVLFRVLPVISTDFRLLCVDLWYRNYPGPWFVMIRNDFFGSAGTFFLLNSLPLDFDFNVIMEDVHRQLDLGEEPMRPKTAAELLMDKVDARARKLCCEIHKNEEDPCALIFSDDMEEKYPDTYYLEAVTALREYGYLFPGRRSQNAWR